MADNAIASGSVILKANADQLANGLTEAKGRVEKFGKEANDKLKDAGKSTGREFAKSLGQDFAQEIGRRSFAGGILGGLAGGGLMGGLSELIANTAGVIGPMFYNWLQNTKEIEHAIKKSSEAMKEMATSTDRTLKISSEWRATMLEPGDKMESMSADVKRLTSDLEKLQIARDSLTKGIHREGWTDYRKSRLAELDAGITAIVDKINPLATEMQKLADRSKDVAFVGQITNATLALREQIVTWGLYGDAATRAMFKAGGATDEMLKKLDEAKAKLKSLAETNAMDPMMKFMLSAADRINKVTQLEGGAPGMFGGIFKGLGMLSGGAAELGKQIERRMRKGDDLFGKAKLAEAVEAGTSEAYSLGVRNVFGTPDPMSDKNREVKTAVDAVRDAVQDGFKQLTDAWRGVGIL